MIAHQNGQLLEEIMFQMSNAYSRYAYRRKEHCINNCFSIMIIIKVVLVISFVATRGTVYENTAEISYICIRVFELFLLITIGSVLALKLKFNYRFAYDN